MDIEEKYNRVHTILVKLRDRSRAADYSLYLESKELTSKLLNIAGRIGQIETSLDKLEKELDRFDLKIDYTQRQKDLGYWGADGQAYDR